MQEISCQDLHKSFGSHQVLKGVSLEIERGEMIAIVGGSGCGKTVLLNMILGQLAFEQGRILVANHALPGAPLVDVSTLGHDIDELHQHWGVVFQRNALFSGSVYTNFELWLSEIRHQDEASIRAIAREALEQVGLPSTDEFLSLDHGQLSGGMSKRLALARALSMNPLVMFYDEPTTGLDPASAAQIQDLIQSSHERARAQALTTLIITHDKDLLRRLQPRVVMLHDGTVFFDGSFEAFEADDTEVSRPYFELMPVLHARQ